MTLKLHPVALTFVLALAAPLPSCRSADPGQDPVSTLRTTGIGSGRQIAAMAVLDQAPDNPEYLQALHRVVSLPGYTSEVRDAALDRLIHHDLDGLKRTIRQHLPRMQGGMWSWLTRLCQVIAEQGWTDLTPALVSSWARPAGFIPDERERPEYQALAKLHGPERVTDVVFELFVESRKVHEQGLRTRCWELLLRLGQRQRLISLLREVSAAADDAFLIDLRAAATDLRIVPSTREEILWIRELRQPDRAEFWSQAAAVIATLDAEQSGHVELRDLPILVSASIHEPELLTTAKSELYRRVHAYVRAQEHHLKGSNVDGNAGNLPQQLHEHRDEYTWGDLAAMLIAVRALQVPEVVAHLFNYAERDKLDTTTEYGGVIALDQQGRFEVLEFPPRVRHHDNRFNAPQEMIEAGYTAVFHFHLHAQRYQGRNYAGPGVGDLNYAENLRVNCLVLTFVDSGVLNVDFYRHGKVIVDLGVIRQGPG